MSKDDIAISVHHVSKSFKLPHERQGSLKNIFVSGFKHKKTYEKQEVLKNTSFEIKKGEFFGIVGRNGSGKSTLLKLLAGIYSPNKGHIHINGKLTPFIELGVGFNPELTGRENVFLNGALLGFNRKEMEDMYDDIVAFAELERFMDQKLKNYSSGMQVRLAFSIAIRSESSILLFDEVLAVGDSAFQKKCYEAFTSLKKEKRTIVFVTHDMTAVERFCDRVLVVHKGESKGVFNSSEASSVYDELNAESQGSEQKKKRWGSAEVRVKEVTFICEGDELKGEPAITGKDLEIHISFEHSVARPIVVGLAFEDMFGVNIAGPNSIGHALSSEGGVAYKIDKLSLLPGEYKVTVAILDEDAIKEYDHIDRSIILKVKSDTHNLHGKVHLFGRWKTTR